MNKKQLENLNLLLKEHFDMKSRDYMYRVLIENMSEGAVVMSNSRTIVYSNKRFADLTGYKLEKVMGSGFDLFLSAPDIESFSACMDEAKDKRSFRELKLKTEHGSIPILVSVISFYIEELLYYGVTISDITFQKNVEEGLELKVEARTLELIATNKRLTQMNSELIEFNNYLDNFVHAIAHDLRAPVANLKLVEEMFRIAPDHEKPKLLSSVRENIQKLDITLKGLVEIIETKGQRNINQPGVDVINLVEQVITEQQKQIKVRNAVIKTEKRTDEKINYVEEFIRSITRNMISNALKYSQPEKQPQLNIVFDKKDDFFTLSFQDNGIGIDLSKHGKNLFKPFQRFTFVSQGMGIGLHIINNMVVKNGGFIDVESEPEKGTKFTVYLKEYAE